MKPASKRIDEEVTYYTQRMDDDISTRTALNDAFIRGVIEGLKIARQHAEHAEKETTWKQ